MSNSSSELSSSSSSSLTSSFSTSRLLSSILKCLSFSLSSSLLGVSRFTSDFFSFSLSFWLFSIFNLLHKIKWMQKFTFSQSSLYKKEKNDKIIVKEIKERRWLMVHTEFWEDRTFQGQKNSFSRTIQGHVAAFVTYLLYMVWNFVP